MKISSLLLIVLLLAGCSHMVPQYTNDQISSGELAKITSTTDPSPFKALGQMKSWIKQVFDSNGNVIADRKQGSAIFEILLPEGEYLFIVECYIDNRVAYPPVKVTIRKYTDYSLTCKKHTTEETLFGSYVSSVKVEINEVNNRKPK